MVRLAFANGYPLQMFYSNLLGCKEHIWNRDIDRHASQALLAMLSQCSHQAPRSLQAHTLKYYEGILFDQLPVVGKAPWILTLGIFHRKRRRAGMQYCPLCLRFDSTPYYRRAWRLALYAVCEHHGCIMQEYCPSCHFPVAYHRHGIGKGEVITKKVMMLCQNCGFDLSQTKPAYLAWPDASSRSSYEKLIRELNNQSLEMGLHLTSFSTLFFLGLHAIVRIINGRFGQKLRGLLSDEIGVQIGVADRSLPSAFEEQSALERLKLMLAACWLIEDWPTRFVHMCREAEIARYRVVYGGLQLPFWFSSVLDEHLDNRPYVHSHIEIVQAGCYLQGLDPLVTPRRFRDLLGLSLSRAQTVWHIWHDKFDDCM